MEIPAHWSDEMGRMVPTWAGVHTEVVEARAKAHERKAEGWRVQLAALRVAQNELVRQGLWSSHGPADLLTVAGFGRSELAHTSILGWLLGPAREHGLGSALLDALLAELNLPPIAPGDRGLVRVSTEETRGGRRADIVVRWPTSALVIEAKVDAEESLNQCDDLFTLFGDEPNVVFLFLTPTGRRPNSATGPAAGAFRTMSFGQVRSGLAGASERGSPTSGSDAVRSYLRTLDHHFSRSTPVQIDARLRFYFQNKRILDEWASLAWEAKAAADQFFRGLVEPMRELQGALGPDVQLYVELDGSYPKVLLYRKSWAGGTGGLRAGVGLEWSRNGAAFDKLCTGTWVNRAQMDTTSALHTRICHELDIHGLPKESRNAWWAAYAYEPTPDGEWWNDLPTFRQRLIGKVHARWDASAKCVDRATMETV
jgi:hypothetical protein